MAIPNAYFAPFRRSRSVLMAHPSSAAPESYLAGLDAYARMGGNSLHLHGEGGETHSRHATGCWLQENGLRDQFFLCAQVCHDGWNEAANHAIDRFNAAAVHEDVADELRLLGTPYLDLVYFDDRPEAPLSAVLTAVSSEISEGRVRAVGIRNCTALRLKEADALLQNLTGTGLAALVTTELSILVANQPLWPEYVPLTSHLRAVIHDLGLVLLAHLSDANLGQSVFGDAGPQRPEWARRWDHPANPRIAARLRAVAEELQTTPRTIQTACALSQPFPVVGIVELPAFGTGVGREYEAGAALRERNADRFLALTEELRLLGG